MMERPMNGRNRFPLIQIRHSADLAKAALQGAEGHRMQTTWHYLRPSGVEAVDVSSFSPTRPMV